MGLRLSDNRHGESDDSSRQQHLEQHAHLSSRPGELSILYAGFIYYLESGKLELMYVLVCFILCVCVKAMASSEEKAYEIMRELDVSYVLVIFGGLTGYSSDGMCY